MKDFLAAAVTIAREAGEIVRAGYGEVGPVELKGEIDLVTRYDKESEAHIVQRLHGLFPAHAIRGEEGGHAGAAATNGYRWLVDPLDGTTNYAHGLPVFAVSIALARGEQIVAGVVYDPMRDELFAAEAGAGATLNAAPIRVSSTPVLEESLLATGFPYDIRTNPENNLNHFANFALRARAVRRPGAAAIDLAWTACGRLDGFWELRLSPWDVAAGGLLVREAGGTVSDLRGGDQWLEPANIVASNGRIHEAMLAVLSAESPE